MAILIGVVFFLAAIWIGVERLGPTYHGHGLSFWIGELKTKPGKESLEAKAALVHFGLVAAPRLAKLLNFQEPKLLATICAKLPNPLRDLLVSRVPAAWIRNRAFNILKEIGPDARTAIPELIRLLESPDAVTRSQAIQILGVIGPPAESAVPVLVTILRSGGVEEREAAARSLGAIGSSAAKVIPDLLSAMKAKRIPLAIAVPALVSVGHTPVEAVPLLIAQLRASTNSPVPLDSVRCLGLIGALSAPAVPALIDALQDPESRTRSPVAFALGQIGPNASNAVPALTGALDDEWWYVRENAAIALGKIGSNASSAIPVLARLTHGDRNEDVRRAAVEAIKAMGRNPDGSPGR